MAAPRYPQQPPAHEQEPVVQQPARPMAAAGTEPVAIQDERRAPSGFRVFQVLAAVAGAVLFVMGIIAVFRVDFGSGFLDTSAEVGGFGFSPALAVAAILLGGAVMVTSLADQDRGATAFFGLLTLAAGLVALVLDGEDQVGVDRQSALMFVMVGAVVFVLSLLPWWSRRRVATYR